MIFDKEKYSAEFEKFAFQKRTNRRLWNISNETASLLYSHILAINPKNILEIGTSNGFSTFWLSLAAEKINANVDTIEADLERFLLAKQNLFSRNNIRMLQGKAELILPTLTEKYNFVFIDAEKKGYINYLNILLTKNLLADSALLFADNIISHAHSTVDYVNKIKSHRDFESLQIDIGSGILISKYLPQSIELPDKVSSN